MESIRDKVKGGIFLQGCCPQLQFCIISSLRVEKRSLSSSTLWLLMSLCCCCCLPLVVGDVPLLLLTSIEGKSVVTIWNQSEPCFASITHTPITLLSLRSSKRRGPKRRGSGAHKLQHHSYSF